MGSSIFRNPSLFRIVDVDKIVLPAPNNFIESYSDWDGFANASMEVERDLEHRGGANYEMMSDDSVFNFDHWKEAFQTINSILDIKGTDANIRLEFENPIGNIRYSSLIVPSSNDRSDVFHTFRTKRQDFGDKFKSRYETVSDISSKQDLDGNTINELPLIKLPLFSKKSNVTGVEIVQDIDIYTESTIGSVTNGTAWGTVGLDRKIKDIDDFFDYGSSYISFISNVGPPDNAFGPPTTNDVFYGTSNPYVQSKLFKYKNTFPNSVNVAITIKHQFTVSENFSNVANFGANEIHVWSVNNAGAFKELIFNNKGNFDPNLRLFNIDVEETVSLDIGDEIYYALSTSVFSAVIIDLNGTIIDSQSGYLSFSINTSLPGTICKGNFIYDVLNKLVQKAIGTTDCGEMVAEVSSISSSFTNGSEVTTPEGAKAKLYTQSATAFGLVDVEGSILTGTTLTETGTGNTCIVDVVTPGPIGTITDSSTWGRIVKCPVIEKIEDGSVSDGCGSLNFVTSGFAIRDFLSEEYDNNRYYAKGDKASYLGFDYTYISDNIEKGNLPTNVTYWNQEPGRKIISAIKKIVDFIKYRYGQGIQIIREEGSSFGIIAEKKITRILIQNQELFFTDKLIGRLTRGESPVRRKFNKDIIFNETEVGYKVFGKENEDDTLSGFNTILKNLTPIEKDKNKLSMIADLGTDGEAIETLRGIQFKESPTESDNQDDETFIIKCQRFNLSNPINSEDLSANPTMTATPVGFFADRFFISDLFLGEYTLSTVTFTGIGAKSDTYTLTGHEYDPETNITTLFTSDTIPGTEETFTSFQFYFDIDVFLPETTQLVENVANVVNPQTTYNMDHTPTNLLINTFAWWGSGLHFKTGSDVVRFTSMKNNEFFEKQYKTNTCEPNTSLTKESQDFVLSDLRTWKPPMFTGYQYIIPCNLDFPLAEKIRLAMIGESDEDINWGYIEFEDNDGTIKEGFIMPSLKYNFTTLHTEVIVWEKA